jgi:recombinational DNA repair ATPase RecF
MNIELISASYKSIKSLKWDDIPEFVVVTGKNGSGKTQLLELLNYHFGTTQKQKSKTKQQANSPFYAAIGE